MTSCSSNAYVRFQSTAPNRHGRFPGVFALVNGLYRADLLTAAQQRFRRRENAWYHTNLRDPTTIDPTVYDRDRHPGAAAWFKTSATQMITRVTGYLEILDHHSIGWVRLHTHDPGIILYDDPHQVVAKPSIGPAKP